MKKFLFGAALFAASVSVMAVPAVSHAFAGKLSYPDGSPAAGAGIDIVADGIRASATCDAYGRFSFPLTPTKGVVMQIKAPDGRKFAPVRLPDKVLANGEVAVVLQTAK
jgi:hypothetical protein